MKIDWQKIITKKNILFFLLLLGFYFFSRIYQLTKLPIFADEAIYIRWSQIMRTEPTLRFVPLQDGKQPLFMWLTIPFLKFFPDPLLAGRMVSVFSGLATLLGVGILTFLLFSQINLAFLAMAFYILTPFCFFFDRMALVDSLLAGFGIWTFIFAFLLAKEKRLDLALILGMILGGAFLTKSPALFFLIMVPILVLGLNFKKKTFKKDFFKLLILLGVSSFLALAIYNILRLGPDFQMIAVRNKDYVWPAAEILKHPWDPLKPHLGDIFRYYWSYLTPVLFILGTAGLVLVFKDFNFLALAFWWLLPLMAQAGMAKVFTARYILFGIPVFLVLAISAFKRLKMKIKKAIVFLFLAFSLHFNFNLWRDPAQAPLPRDERAGYLQDWTAGQGIKEISDYLKGLPRDKGIVVGTEGYFGTLPDGLQIYLQGEKDITVFGVGQPMVVLSKELINARDFGNDVFLVVNQSRFLIPDSGNLELIKDFEKPEGDKLLFFKLK